MRATSVHEPQSILLPLVPILGVWDGSETSTIRRVDRTAIGRATITRIRAACPGTGVRERFVWVQASDPAARWVM